MKNRKGIPMTPEELEEYNQVWKDINESIELVMNHGRDLVS